VNYDDWLSWVFDQPVAHANEPAWYFGPDSAAWDPESAAEQTLEYLARLFSEAGILRQRFSSSQIAQGLWFLCDPSCSSHFFSLTDPGLPWQRRKSALAAILLLFRDLFAKECVPHLSHMQEQLDTDDSTATSDLNLICYMFWDVAPLHPHGTTEQPDPADQVCLDVMEQTLALPHPACQEAALHGLGHWSGAYPEKVSEIIDRYLALGQIVSELTTYASQARDGQVL
jgi:hypothetical protein